MSKIKKMDLEYILDKTDVIMRRNDIIYICEDMNIVKEFISKFKNNETNREELKNFLFEHEEYIDKEKFILLMVNNYKENIDLLKEHLDAYKAEVLNKQDPEAFSKLANIHVQLHQQQENYENAKKLGSGIEVVFTDYYYDEEQKRYKVNVVDSREVINGRKINTSKATKKFDELDLNFKGGNPKEKFGMEFMLQSILLTDLYNVFPSEKFGNEIRTMILENQALKLGTKTREELEKLKTIENFKEYIKLLDEISFEGLLPDIKSTLREYAEYLDLDQLMIISGYRFYEILEHGNINNEMCLGIKEILNGLLDNIKNKNLQFSFELQNKYTYEAEQITFGVKDIKKCLSQYTSETYLNSKQIQENRSKIDSGELSLMDIPSEYIDVLFSNKELENLSLLSPENLICVFKRNNWETAKIIELYENAIISLKDINKIKESIDLSNDVCIEKLNTYYKGKDNKNERTIAEYNRYLDLYKEIFIKDKTVEDNHIISSKIMDSIVEEFEGKKYDEVLKNYFKEGLIDLEGVVDWTNENFLTELLAEEYISLDDIALLVKEKKLPVEYLNQRYTELINNEELEYNQRLELIKSGFVKEEDIFNLYKRNLIFENDLKKLAEEKFIGLRETQRIINSRTMEELEKNSAIRLTGLNSLEKKKNEIYSSNNESEKRKSTGKFVIDPNERERFLRLLKAYRANTDLEEDSPFYNYEFYVIPDESGAIGLESVVIAERYYEDKNTEHKFSKDNATYFFKYKDLMVLSNLRKSDMTKERKDIVFTANHIIANEKREGSWAKSVLNCLTKTMMSCDLKEYNKKNQQIIVRQKLKQMYPSQELKEILEMAYDIDSGKYIGEIERTITTVKNTEKNSKEEIR